MPDDRYFDGLNIGLALAGNDAVLAARTAEDIAAYARQLQAQVRDLKTKLADKDVLEIHTRARVAALQATLKIIAAQHGSAVSDALGKVFRETFTQRVRELASEIGQDSATLDPTALAELANSRYEHVANLLDIRR